jgi:hypothetical protein
VSDPWENEVLNLESERAQAERYAEALDAVARGDVADVDPREDPEIVASLQTARWLRTELAAFEPHPRYVNRSRALLLRMAARRNASHVQEQRGRARWWGLGAVAGAAAAASLVTFAVLGVDGGTGAVETAPGETGSTVQLAIPGPADPVGEPNAAVSVEPSLAQQNLTASAIDTDLRSIRVAFDTIVATSERGGPVESGALRILAEGTARVARQIEERPDSVAPDRVVAYISGAADARALLDQVTPESGQESALASARAAAQDGVVVASRYFLDDSAGDVSDGDDQPGS